METIPSTAGLDSDTFYGGAGNDTYIIDGTSDNIFEYTGEGIDTVRSSINYFMTFTNGVGNEIENLTLTGTDSINGTGNSLSNILAGNVSNNTLTGNEGNDTLDGGAGIDNLKGGIGDDTYIVDTTTDTMTENTSGGIDTIQSSVSYMLAVPSSTKEFENLTLTGAAVINGTGNALANVLVGNVSGNILTAGDGNDTLDGGAGVDTLIGGVGDDVYVVDTTTDTITENTGEGADLVQSSVTYTLQAANVENLRLFGSTSINGTGNSLNNILTGNAAANLLNGLAGNDSLSGGDGNDNLFGGDDNDTLMGGAAGDALDGGAGDDLASYANAAAGVIANLLVPGTNTGDAAGDTYVSIEWLAGSSHNDQLYGNNLVNRLAGGAGNDVLRGFLGNDLLWGQAGKDIFLFNTALNAAANIDSILDFVVVDDTIYLENAIFTALGAAGALAAAAFAANATGLAGDASDRIIHETGTGKLFYDADGTGAIAGVHFATLTVGLALTAADFLVI